MYVYCVALRELYNLVLYPFSLLLSTPKRSHHHWLTLQRDSGLWGALMIFFGLGGATVAGIIIDYTKMYKDVSIVSIGFAIISLVWFMEV